MRSAPIPLLLLLALLSFPGAAISQQPLPMKSLEAVRKACVEIHINKQLRGGGAFVENEDGRNFIITAAHLFENKNAPCRVLTSDDKSHSATLIAYDFGHDLALLEVTGEGNFPTIPIAEKVPQETAPIFNFGPALRRRTLVISGNVADSRPSYTDFTPSRGYVEHFFVAGISPVLTSGGVWVNRDGEIIGIQHGRLIGDKGSPSSGLSIASPPIALKRLLNRKQNASTPDIGGWIWEVWTADGELLKLIPKDTEGLVVTWVQENGPLDRAGVKRLDIILSCNGIKLVRRHTFLHEIRSNVVGTEFELEVISPDNLEPRKITLITTPLEKRWE